MHTMGSRMTLRQVDKTLKVSGNNIDSLRINYGSDDWMHSPTKTRKEHLKKMANFDCTCEKCADPIGDMLADTQLKEECPKCKELVCLSSYGKVCLKCGFRVQFADQGNAMTFIRGSEEVSAMGEAASAKMIGDLFPSLSKIDFPPQNRNVYSLAFMFLHKVTESQGPNPSLDFSDGELKERTCFAMEKCTGALEGVGLVYTPRYRELLKRAVKLYSAMGEPAKAVEAKKKMQNSMLQFG